jgi:predicted RNA-binding protein YlqC (UPF0109 family)
MKLLVDNPATLNVEVLTDGAVTVLKISGNTKQVGCLIGKGGRTSRSMRILLHGITHRTGDKIRFDICEIPA